MEEGKYQYLDYHYSSTINEVNKYARELLINPYDGYNSVFRHSSRPFIGMRYHQWEGLLLLERMYRDVEKGIRKMPRLQSVLLMGICKDAFAALILAQRLKKDFPHLHIGVWGCPWPVDLSGQSPVYRGIKVSPSHEQIRKKDRLKIFWSVMEIHSNCFSSRNPPDFVCLLFTVPVNIGLLMKKRRTDWLLTF